MKTIFVIDPDPKDSNDAIWQLTNSLPTDIPVEIKVIETEPHIELSLTYDETLMNEEELFEALDIGEYVYRAVVDVTE